MTAVVHLSGATVFVGTVMRQRCAWCGALLIDDDLATMQVAVVAGEEPRPPSGFEENTFVAVEGDDRSTKVMWAVPPPPDRRLPEGACAALDPAVTR